MAPVNNTRYNSIHMMFEVDEDSFSEHKMTEYASENKLKDLIVLNPSVTGNKRYRCYGTRQNNAAFNYKNGCSSLAKKLKVDPKAVSLINIRKNQKMPDHFFDLLDPSKAFDSQITMAVGRYAESAMIKAHIDTSLRQNKNRQVCSKIRDEGALKAVESGTLSVGQLKSAKAYEAELSKEKEKVERLAREIPNGHCLMFTCFKTDISYKIFSRLGENVAKNRKEERLVSYQDESGTVHMIVGDGELSTKRKHYYFYGRAPGYGKTTFITSLIKHTNAAVVADLHNWTNVLEDAHFIVIDEYGLKTNRLSLDDLKRLTSGNASTFAGNRKSYGSSYIPRNDAQLIIFSNNHLFEAMGVKDPKDGVRKVSMKNAEILSDRFHIYRLDEVAPGDLDHEVSNEATDRLYHTEK